MIPQQPITLLYPTATSDGAGGETHTFTSYGADWAEIKAERVSQEDNTKQVATGAAMRFKIRYRASLSITDKWRIRYEGTDYRITTIEREGLKREYYIIKATALT
jgi:SPP1 family predicted phage head-tail adaptor